MGARVCVMCVCVMCVSRSRIREIHVRKKHIPTTVRPPRAHEKRNVSTQRGAREREERNYAMRQSLEPSLPTLTAGPPIRSRCSPVQELLGGVSPVRRAPRSWSCREGQLEMMFFLGGGGREKESEQPQPHSRALGIAYMLIRGRL